MPQTLEEQVKINAELINAIANELGNTQAIVEAQKKALEEQKQKICNLELQLAEQTTRTSIAEQEIIKLQRLAPLFLLPESVSSKLLLPLPQDNCYNELISRLDDTLKFLHEMPFHPHSELPKPDLMPLRQLLTILVDLYEGLNVIHVKDTQQYLYELYIQLSGQDTVSSHLEVLLQKLTELDLTSAFTLLNPQLNNTKATELSSQIHKLSGDYKDVITSYNEATFNSLSESHLIKLKNFFATDPEAENLEIAQLIDSLLLNISTFNALPSINEILTEQANSINAALLPGVPFEIPSACNDEIVSNFFKLMQKQISPTSRESNFHKQMKVEINATKAQIAAKISGVKSNTSASTLIARGGWMALSLVPVLGIVGLIGSEMQNINTKKDRHFIIIANRALSTMLDQLPSILEELFQPYLTQLKTGAIGAQAELTNKKDQNIKLVNIISNYLKDKYLQNMNDTTEKLAKFMKIYPNTITTAEFLTVNLIFELLHSSELEHFKILNSSNETLRESGVKNKKGYACQLPASIEPIYLKLCDFNKPNQSLIKKISLGQN